MGGALAATNHKTGVVATTTGWLWAGSQVQHAGVGGNNWSQGVRVTGAANGSLAFSTAPGPTYFMRLYNFGFTSSDVPPGATILGARFELYLAATGDATDSSIILVDHFFNTSADWIGSNKSTGAAWTGTVAHGGAADTWGASLTQSLVTSSTFGIEVAAAQSTGNAQIDAGRCQFTYV